mmetsp:Transcript_29982/g.59550  ORF Transcript_29982/g.59550 Transcript_29982/m.59550 type:complete len:385 (+) Transcript_29982:181-1335(+)
MHSRMYSRVLPLAAAVGIMVPPLLRVKSPAPSSGSSCDDSRVRKSLLPLPPFLPPRAVALCESPPAGGAAEEAKYYNFPASQKFTYPVEPPLWDRNWDGLKDRSVSRKKGVTRHVILVRHGQYDETHKDDARRILTELGRRQAKKTGERLAELIKAAGPGSLKVRALRSSDMARAKETCDIIHSEITKAGLEVSRSEPDKDLNEGRPCQVIPSSRPWKEEVIRKDGERIERAFKRYFFRSTEEAAEEVRAEKDEEKGAKATENNGVKTAQQVEEESRGRISRYVAALWQHGPNADNPSADATVTPPPSNHEFEIIVCHGNVIRYFFMRALQLPPEAWLRLCTFNCSLAYFTLRSEGGVSCRSLGDMGHLTPEEITFSGHHGLNW